MQIHIEMQDEFIPNIFLKEFENVLQKMYILNRLHYKAETAPKEEAEKMKKQAKDIAMEYERAYAVGMGAIELITKKFCSFSVDENEKAYGVVMSDNPRNFVEHQKEKEWVIKIYKEDMEPLMAQRPQSN